MAEAASPNMDRRNFLHNIIGAGLGLAAGATVLPAASETFDESITEIAHVPAGNASYEQKAKDQCAGAENPQRCQAEWKPSTSDKIGGLVVAPIVEEVGFRGLPAFFLELSEDPKNNPLPAVMRGSLDPKLSRKEIVTGVVSSLLFGLSHNLTSKGIDTRTVPAGITCGGMALWSLARIFGLPASVATHFGINFAASRR